MAELTFIINSIYIYKNIILVCYVTLTLYLLFYLNIIIWKVKWKTVIYTFIIQSYTYQFIFFKSFDYT